MTAVLVMAGVYVLTIWEAFAVKTLWAWFAAPQFGLPQIGMAHAVGLVLLANLLTHQTPGPDDDERTQRVLNRAIFLPVVTLAVGWIAKQFL